MFHLFKRIKFNFCRYKQLILKIQILGVVENQEEQIIMNSYRQLENQLKKMIDNENKCSEFVKFITKGMDTKQNYTKNKLIQVDQSSLETVQIHHLIQAKIQPQWVNNASIEFKKEKKTISNRQEDKIKQSTRKFEESTMNDNQFLRENQPEHNFCYFDRSSSKRNEYSISTPFEAITINQNNCSEHQYNYQSDHEQNQEYFELQIVNDNFQGEKSMVDQYHQVKLYSSNNVNSQFDQNINRPYNLSNFSSFNGKNLPLNNNSSLQKVSILESQFYQKQFIYLVKKIQLIHGKKLSSKGIERVAMQLQSSAQALDPNASQKIIITSQKLTQMLKVKDVTQKMINQRIQKDKINCDSKTEKKIKYETKKEKDTNTKSKIKLPIANIYQQRNQNNKENYKTFFETDKNKCKKEKDRSVSPLSYRVLMQKKKNQKEKSKEKTKIQSNNYPYSQSQNRQIIKKSHQMNQDRSYRLFTSVKDCNFLKKQKLNSLKIILDQNSNQSRTKTLCFEYLSNNKNLNREVEQYCNQNSIKGKNIKLIQQALHQRRPIVTLKQN